MEVSTRNLLRSRPVRIAIASLFTIVIVIFLVSSRSQSVYEPQPWKADSPIQVTGQQPTDLAGVSTSLPKVHILLLATKSNVKLCKTLLTLTLLGYPSPHLISWGETDNAKALLGGGSHFGKITGTLDYINKNLSGPDTQDDLILLVDAYDVWFQLPLEVLLSRYHTVIKEDNARLAYRMGRAFTREGINSGVVFGAGKRCGPNSLHTVACYPVPDSPLPKDLFGSSTDTAVGHNEWSSYRTRYLNAGTAIGPVNMLRPLLKRAHAKLLECRGRKDADFDAGTGVSDFCYHGSDQSIWMEIFGQQEFQREVMRRHHRSWYDGWLEKINPGRAGSWPPPTQMYGVPISDFLEPDFFHQPGEKAYKPDKPYEFGISLDYWSMLGHQTSNAFWDAKYIRRDQPLNSQAGKRNGFDCKAKSPDWNEISDELLSKLLPGQTDKWQSLPFYTEFCVGQIPVMIHHNSVYKDQIHLQWNSTWWYGHSRALLDAKRRDGAPQLLEGIPTDQGGTTLKWEELCPPEYDAELFGVLAESDSHT